MTILLVIPQIALQDIQSAIVQAAHMATDAAGERLTLATIDGRTLESAARLALEVATGEVVWSSGDRLKLRQPKRQMSGVVEIE